MAFLTPLFFLGLLGLSVPVLIHLQRKHRTVVQRFPSLMFLESIEIPTRRRRRIRNWLLLALRSLVIVLLVVSFARPWLPAGAEGLQAGGEGRALVVLLDNSFSMGFEDRWERAQAAARQALNGVGPGDRAVLVSFARTAAALGEPSSDVIALEAQLNSVELSSYGTRFEPALRMARKLLMESELPRREVVFISDFQRSAWSGDERLELPRGTQLRVVDLSDRDRLGAAPPNAVVASLLIDHEQGDDRERVALRARVANRGEAELSEITVALELNGRSLSEQTLTLGGGVTSVVEFEDFSLPEGVSRGVVRLAGDRLDRDNAFYFVLSRSQALPVAVVERARVGSPPSGFYVERALALSRRPRFDVRGIEDRRFSTQDIDRAELIVMSDVALPTGATADRLVRFVEEGGGLLVGLGSRSQASSHSALAERGLLPAIVGEASAARGTASRISYFDRSSPGFESFSAPRSGDFGSARFFRFHRVAIDPEVDRVLARFSEGEPALIERQVGEGRVLVWTSSLDRYWNDFPLKPIFVPFLHQALGRLSSFRPLQSWNEVGEILDLAAVVGAAGGEATAIEEIVTPDGDSSPDGGLLALEHEGFYEVAIEDSEPWVLAANLEGVESDLTSLDAEELAARISPREQGPAGDSTGEPATPEQRERTQGLWRYLLVALLLLLAAETFVANRGRERLA